VETNNIQAKLNKKLCYRRRTARRAMSVKILSTVETSSTANPQQIAVMELEGYSRPTCSKQARLVNCRIGVVNKLDRRRRRRVLLTTRSTCRGEIFQVRSSGQSPRGKYPNFWRYQYFLTTEGGLGGRTPPCQKQLDSSGCFDKYPLVTDGRTDGHATTAYTALA